MVHVKTTVSKPLINANGEPIEFGRVRIVKRQGQRDKIYGDFTRRSHFGNVAIEQIKIDPEYQRVIQKPKVTTMAHRWNQDLAGVPVVSQRSDGYYYMVDGQHRLESLKLMENCPSHIFCEIFQHLTPVEEAWLFRALDNQRDNLTPGADYRAALAAKDPTALGIKRAVEAVGMTIDYQKGATPGNVRSFKTLYKVYKRVGEPGLIRILDTLHKAWPHDKNASNHQMILGVEAFYRRFPKADDKRLIQALSVPYRGAEPLTPLKIVTEAGSYQTALSSQIGDAVAFALCGIYNKGRQEQNKLIW